VQLAQSPQLYSTFLLWMLSELYERLPEAGDLPKPKIVFFFDEAHLLFDNAPAALLRQVEQVARLIRSKGVGIYFISQSPADVPDTVLAQLGNKIQHALRAYTPKEQKAVRAAAQSFRANPAFDTETAIGALGTGEALVSFLGADGVPAVVQRAKILPPRSFTGVAEPELVAQRVQASPLYAKYATPVDRESAYEILTQVTQQQAADAAAAKQAEADAKQAEKDRLAAEKQAEKERAAAAKAAEKEKAAAEKAKAKAATKKKTSKTTSKATTAITRVATNAASQFVRSAISAWFRKK